MEKKKWFLPFCHACLLLGALTVARAQTGESQTLPDVTAKDAAAQFATTSGQVTVAPSTDPAQPGLVVTIQPGPEGYPGVKLQPRDAKVWDLSAYGHIEAKVTNTGAKGISVSLRVDNPGDWRQSPWNTEQASLKPGQTRTIKVIFGYAYGKKPGYPLNPAAVSQVMFFTGRAKEAQSFRIEALEAGGSAGEQPPVDPNSVRTPPANGHLFGGAAPFDAAKQLKAQNGAQAALTGKGVTVTLPAKNAGAKVEFTPAIGRWDLRLCTAVTVTVENTGKSPAAPRTLVASNGGATAWGALAKPLAPGETAPITATFVAATPWQGIPDASKTHWDGQKDTGTKFQSDTVKAVVLAADENGAELRVQAITAQATPMETPPWLGQRPPVEGDWVKSFAEEFDTATIDAAKWNIYGENFWDKASHFSKDNLLLGGGVAKLRYEKKRGCHNDDPKQTLALTNPKVSESAYATGFLDTYGKWTQRYGYFEARMKLPSAPGLWPAFWLMPDRGVAAGPQWKRADTGNGGMEFDIMEHLTRWGPYRYNIAMHWDGYGKAHKQTGSTGIYFQPDTEGFITAGLLWTPGLIVIYANGKEVARWESPRISNVQSHLMFTHVMGGWDNNALDDAKLPADFVIDYVRCWQRRDLASALDGPKPPAAIPAPTPAAE